MLSYANIPLGHPTPELAAWIEQNVHPRDIYEFPTETWPGPTRAAWPWQNYAPSKVKLNSFCWPVGASRWACGNFLASEGQLNSIRLLPFNSYPFTISDGDVAFGGHALTTNLWMLPAVPLSQAATGGGMYLLPLVDDRWFWWHRTADFDVPDDGSVTWGSLIGAIGAAIGTTIAGDLISSAYLTPSDTISGRYEFLPPLLDAVARSVGMRVTRGFDGSVSMQGPATAEAVAIAQLSLAFTPYAGGEYSI